MRDRGAKFNLRRCLRVGVALWFALLLAPAQAVVTVDNVSTGRSGSPTSMTVSHTTGAGVDRLMLVGVSLLNNDLETVTSVTYNGAPLTFVGQRSQSNDSRVEIWSLLNPPSITANVVVTFNEQVQFGAVVGVITFDSVDQVSPYGAFQSNSGDSITATATVTSAIGETVFGVMAAEMQDSNPAVSGGSAQWSLKAQNGNNRTAGAGATFSGAASVGLTWNLNEPDDWAIGAISLRDSGGIMCNTFRDEFSSISYARQDGSANWSADWNEVGDNGSPLDGTIQIGSNSLQFEGDGSASNPLNGPYIEREADLSPYTSATLSFDYRETGNWEGGDRFEIHISSDGGVSWTLLQRFSNDQGSTFQSFSADITAYISANTRIAFVERANAADEIFYVDNVQIYACGVVPPLDHFRITPATTTASTCLPNAITIVAEDSSNNPITDYTGTINITTSTNNGNWSVNTASNVTVPNPDTDDDGAVAYSFLVADAGDIILDLSNTHAETLTITVSDAAAAVSSTSVAIGFADNVFVITEDPVQVAGRPQAMNVALWTNDGANCFIDTNYNYAAITLDASIDRGGVLPGANDPTIGAATIPDAPLTAGVTLDFSLIPGQANFSLGSSDVGQYTLNLADNTNTHGDVVIVGSSAVLTVRPFGIAVTSIEAGPGPTANPGGSAPVDPVFTTAGADFSATVAGVLWSAADDTDNDGVLDTGVYANNAVAPSYAWLTVLDRDVAAARYTPSPGTVGTLNNGNIPQASFGGGSATVTNLQYTEVGSFTLQSAATDFLGEPSADIVGDDIVVGRFIPASFLLSVTTDGALAESCGAFTYLGESFGYATAPVFRATAQNALGATTAQYRDGFVKLSAASVSITVSQDDTTLGSDLGPLLVSYTPAAMGFVANNNGTMDYTFGADIYRYGPAAPVGFAKYDNSQVAPFPADINPLIASLVDGDGVAEGNNPTLNPAGNNQRFGRLRMNNAHGSELDTLTMPVFTDYWNGTAFQRNMLDTCTTIADAHLLEVVANPPGLSVPTVVSSPASAGIVDYDYPAPGAGNDGFVETRTDLSLAGHLWLRFDWDADGVFDNDPTARATFGIYEGNPVQIYLRQTYQ